MRAARAAGFRPKETLETPSEVSTPGSSRLMRRMPSIVSTAEVENSASPVASVNVRSSKISAPGGQSVLTDHDLVDAARDFEFALRGLGHAGLVDGERDHGRPVLFGQR